MMKILNDILDFSKIESSQVNLENLNFDLPQLFSDIYTLFEPQTSKNNNQLKLELATNLPQWVRGDPTRIKQIAINLVSNALKFTKNGTVTICAQVQNIDDETCNIYVAVVDTGIGIDDSYYTKVFDAFNQADSTISKKYGGTGLGLSICQKLAAAMGFTIKLDSKADQGSTFYIDMTLPIGAAHC